MEEQIQLLAEAQKELLEALKIQQSMINDLKEYVEKRDEIVNEMLTKLNDIWQEVA